jgi:predicted nucleic acid-binding protein
MILADTDILSAIAKVTRVPLLFSLFQTTTLHITPGVFRELEYSFNAGHPYAKEPFDLITAGQIQMLYLTPEEAAFRDTLPTSLSTGERDSIAVAKERGGIVLSNESRVAHWCRLYEISCLRLPDIL